MKTLETFTCWLILFVLMFQQERLEKEAESRRVREEVLNKNKHKDAL